MVGDLFFDAELTLCMAIRATNTPSPPPPSLLTFAIRSANLMARLSLYWQVKILHCPFVKVNFAFPLEMPCIYYESAFFQYPRYACECLCVSLFLSFQFSFLYLDGFLFLSVNWMLVAFLCFFSLACVLSLSHTLSLSFSHARFLNILHTANFPLDFFTSSYVFFTHPIHFITLRFSSVPSNSLSNLLFFALRTTLE